MSGEIADFSNLPFRMEIDRRAATTLADGRRQLKLLESVMNEAVRRGLTFDHWVDAELREYIEIRA